MTSALKGYLTVIYLNSDYFNRAGGALALGHEATPIGEIAPGDR